MSINIGLFHVGEAIKDRLKSMNLTQDDFAGLLGITQPSVNAMLKKSSINTDVLKRICIHLDYNFFEDFCPDLKKNKGEQTIHRDAESNGETIKELILQMSYLRSENEKKDKEIELKNKEIERLMAVMDTLTSIKSKVTSDSKKTAGL